MSETANTLKRAINKFLSPLDAQIAMNSRVIDTATKARKYLQLTEIIACDELTDKAKVDLCKNITSSYSQIGQDLVAILVNGSSEGLFFVEFGAAGGKVASNTYLLERKFSWNGIVAEPAQGYKDELNLTRDCIKDFRCVYSESGQSIQFIESKTSMLSTIAGFEKSDLLSKDRKIKSKYMVQTVSLIDLLREHHAPKEIGYISIDTEGSEFQILNAFDFNEYQFNFISVEHNTLTQEELIEDLLTSKGYRRILRDLSKFDSWYVLSSLELDEIIVNWTE
jgi:FkbM family methyltransferase